MEVKHSWDVLIVGAGPAGTASAITLAAKGWRVLLIEKQTTGLTKFGESLPPAAVGLVEKILGPLSQIDMAAHGIAKTAGNVSCWQSAEPEVNDFFYTPDGFGLCIDRAIFDDVLLSRAKSSGARLQSSAQFIQCHHCDVAGNWSVEIQNAKGREWHQAKYLIDSSGRQAIVAHSLGVTRQQQDKLFAYAQRFVAHNPQNNSPQDSDRFTRLEASSQGWWYSNRLPSTGLDHTNLNQTKTQRIVVFHTDRDLDYAKQAATVSGFNHLLQKSRHIVGLLEKYGYQPLGKIRGASAASERLTQFAGNAWLAVGDAAQAYDPLSSQGITKALTSGTMAGQLVHYALNSFVRHRNRSADLPLFKRYADEQERLWTSYLQQYQYYYHSQSRWPDQLYWSRRAQTASGATTNLLREAQ